MRLSRITDFSYLLEKLRRIRLDLQRIQAHYGGTLDDLIVLLTEPLAEEAYENL
ncbi:hypothetical protein XF_0376 [Xylella fastidiosa 9a5c]|uniref:Uncharacterized protein n=1 Tax=Xylella fastidiosa (strain 9a5c) TaxID=160492 RepID=Q9PGC6_XYLFA|nr:hypothetical protein XF_0376 [Xylella fastidiosa 9a5c]